MQVLSLTREQFDIISKLDPSEVEQVENAVFVMQNARHYSTTKLVASGRILDRHGLRGMLSR